MFLEYTNLLSLKFLAISSSKNRLGVLHVQIFHVDEHLLDDVNLDRALCAAFYWVSAMVVLHININARHSGGGARARNWENSVK